MQSTSPEKEPFSGQLYKRVKENFVGRLLFDKKFFVYTCVGLLVSATNVGLLWLLIDIFGMKTVVAGIIATATVFILRYVLLIFFKIV